MDDSAKIYLGIALMIVMVGMGLSLTLSDFKRVLLYPKAALIGVFNQMVMLPILAFLLLQVMEMRPELAVGLMVLAVCPGGPTSNLITNLCKGDVALSVTLTAISSVLTLFTIPFLMDLNLRHFMGDSAEIVIDRTSVFKDLAMVVIVPVIVGMLINRFSPAFALKMEKPVKIASGLILLVLIVGLCVKESDKLLPYLREAGLPSLMLNVISLVAAFFIAKLFKLSKAQSLTISIETGIQNGTLAIALCLGVLKNPDYAIPPAIYSLIMFLTAFVLIGYNNMGDRKSNIESAE